jgi:hypothetical protein
VFELAIDAQQLPRDRLHEALAPVTPPELYILAQIETSWDHIQIDAGHSIVSRKVGGLARQLSHADFQQVAVDCLEVKILLQGCFDSTDFTDKPRDLRRQI